MSTRDASRREFLRAAGLGAVTLTVPCFTHGAKGTDTQTPPNVVLILTDDQGYADVGCYGAEGFSTPNLDRMAAEGIRFTDFYAPAPVCTPSRAALMTGCYPLRVGLPQVLGPKEWKLKGKVQHSNIGISSGEETIAELLKAQGYATACFGKWHLGDYPEFLPTRHGFDRYFGLPYSNDMGPEHPKAGEVEFPPLPLLDGEKTVQTDPDQAQLTTWYTERAVRFIEENKTRPFFLYLAHSMPHVPLHVSEKFAGKSERGLYGDVIMEIDWSVGQVLSALKSCGIDDRTLVIFTSDNGPDRLFGDHAGSAKPLREGKATTFEGGQRVPCIMRWPGNIPAGTKCAELASLMDMLPTIAHLAGAKQPALAIDGKDVRPLVLGETGATSPHDVFFYYLGDKLQAVRSGKWKLHLQHAYPKVVEPGKDGKPGKITLGAIGPALFDLSSDIGEKQDVSGDHPEVVQRLSAAAAKFDEELRRACRSPGRISSTVDDTVSGGNNS